MDSVRSIEPSIASDLPSKMVFVAGPRQVGKTTLARHALAAAARGMYLSWDNSADRKEIRAARWPAGESLVVLDELHKWRGWKTWLKGEFDKHREHTRFLVTGSARLDVYRRGGDSLQGRYHHYRLHPFSCAEALAPAALPAIAPGKPLTLPDHASPEVLAALLAYGGFPEPFLAGSERTHRRWQKERMERFFREDVRDLDAVRDLSTFEHLADLLPDRVGSPLSLNSLRGDLEVSHRAMTNWMEVLDRLYHVFRVRPFTTPRARVLTKMPKAYLWDSSLVPDPGARFENLVALHLLKLCHTLEDTEGEPVALHYLRDREGREVDFLVTWKRKPWFAVEAKLSATSVAPSLVYFRELLGIPYSFQITRDGTPDFVEKGVHVLSAARFLPALV
ncbi:MAG: ATP-binding protein [Acidobacteria bacterium]|nr:ATP-binding protein [Acidobacteriota bacterium]